MIAERVAWGMLEMADKWAVEGSSVRAIVEDVVWVCDLEAVSSAYGV